MSLLIGLLARASGLSRSSIYQGIGVPLNLMSQPLQRGGELSKFPNQQAGFPEGFARELSYIRAAFLNDRLHVLSRLGQFFGHLLYSRDTLMNPIHKPWHGLIHA